VTAIAPWGSVGLTDDRTFADAEYGRADGSPVVSVAAGGSVPDAAARVGIRPSTAKRHLADLRARSGLTTEQLIYQGRAEGWLVVPSLEAE